MMRIAALLIVFAMATTSVADEPKNATQTDSETISRERQLAEYLSGKKFVGQFTVDGKDRPPKTEEYLIHKCEKLDADLMYRMTVRIKYGDVDQEVPLDVKIVFAESTPVITLDSMWIPGMGTFDARVLIRRDRYAGTWKHDANGGHLFGRIKAIDAETIDTKSANDDQ